jgi:DNA repair exonuclease SbcCD ATPase subunit
MASRIEQEAAEVVGLSRRLQPLRIALAGAVERRKQAVRLRAQLMDAEAGLATLEAEVAAEKDFQHLIGREGFLGGIFDEVLAEIGDETSQTLAAVANTRHCTFRFKSETTTQKGTTKRAIVPTITVNGHEAPMGSALSGGMLSTLELAVDLAVGAVISRRSGVSPGWLILDESFDGLDPISKESCLEILQKYARDRLVIVVDHMSETKGLFTDRIVVEYRGGDSRVTYGGATA